MNRKTSWWFSVCVLSGGLLWTAHAQVPMGTGTLSGVTATNDARLSPTGKLQSLQQKAESRDAMARKVNDLEQEVTTLQGSLDETTNQLSELRVKDRSARLQDLERKAIAYATLQLTMKKKEEEVRGLSNELEAQKKRNQELQDQIDAMMVQNGYLHKKTSDMEQAQKSLQQTLEQFWLGNYEYYEARDGDTVGSIAAMPEYYNDASRAIWIRQANMGHVEDIERLKSGEMLIIPRFPPTGKYDF